MVFVIAELSTEEEEEGDDEDGSSDEFTDSIEDDDGHVTARHLSSIQVKYFEMYSVCDGDMNFELCITECF